MKHILAVVCFFCSASILNAEGKIRPATNPFGKDGFGSQFQSIIYAVVYSEYHRKNFIYSPFRYMAHNYDADPTYLERKENLINFIGHFEVNYDEKRQQLIGLKGYIVQDFFEKNIELCSKSASLAKIKAIFRENKTRTDYLDDEHVHIAMHIRRPNSHDIRGGTTDVTDEVYLQILEDLKNKYAEKNYLIHIYSQGKLSDFEETFGGDDTLLHINESLEDSFIGMVLADVLVTSVSSFSYCAALISEGEIYYIPFWHPPLPGWNVLNTREYSPGRPFKRKNLKKQHKVS